MSGHFCLLHGFAGTAESWDEVVALLPPESLVLLPELPGPEAAARIILGLLGSTTRSCSWIAWERTWGRSVRGFQTGNGSSQSVVFQMPPSLAPT